MACKQPFKMDIGDTEVLRLTWTDDNGDRMDLDSDVTEIELQVKAEPGDADPPLIALAMVASTEIVKLAQSGDTLGQADATISSDKTSGMAAGIYSYDVVAFLTAGGRKHGVKASEFELAAVVNNA